MRLLLSLQLLRVWNVALLVWWVMLAAAASAASMPEKAMLSLFLILFHLYAAVFLNKAIDHVRKTLRK